MITSETQTIIQTDSEPKKVQTLLLALCGTGGTNYSSSIWSRKYGSKKIRYYSGSSLYVCNLCTSKHRKQIITTKLVMTFINCLEERIFTFNVRNECKQIFNGFFFIQLTEFFLNFVKTGLKVLIWNFNLKNFHCFDLALPYKLLEIFSSKGLS